MIEFIIVYWEPISPGSIILRPMRCAGYYYPKTPEANEPLFLAFMHTVLTSRALV